MTEYLNTRTLAVGVIAVVGLVLGAMALITKLKGSLDWLLGGKKFKAKELMTPNEVEFYNRLRSALDSSWVVFPQVSMGALVDTTTKESSANYWNERVKFQSKICDYIICNATTLKPHLVVELDDITHSAEKDKIRDAITAEAGYRTLRFVSRKKPSVPQLREVLTKTLYAT